MSVNSAYSFEFTPQAEKFQNSSSGSGISPVEFQTGRVPTQNSITEAEPHEMVLYDSENPDHPDNIAPSHPDDIAPSHPDDIAPDYPADLNLGAPGAVQKGATDIGRGLSPVPPALPKTPARRLPQGFFA